MFVVAYLEVVTLIATGGPTRAPISSDIDSNAHWFTWTVGEGISGARA